METETTVPLSANPTANARAGRPGRRPLVLVVDDDRDARVIYRQYLRAMGCRVVTASDGALAIEKATRWHPDVIVMDLSMPHVDGWTATKRLRQQRDTRHIPIVALTAAPMARGSAHAAGCDAFLAKPCLPELLWWEVRALLNDRSHPSST